MNLKVSIDDTDIHHSVKESFGYLLPLAIKDIDICVAHGPIYQSDPADEILQPFYRSAKETGLQIEREEFLAPQEILEKAREIRSHFVSTAIANNSIPEDYNKWTRAGLVLEIAGRRGIHVHGRGKMYNVWKLNGTATNRFGVEPTRGPGWTFSPLSLSEDDRCRIRASDHTRQVAVLDFRAIDLCSMIALIPGLKEKYGDHPDPHSRTAELTGLSRDIAKQELFVFTYGGQSEYAAVFEKNIPELSAWFKSKPHGDVAREVQRKSAKAFRSALSNTLPLLIGEQVMPMFTVHDELTLDVSDVGQNKLPDIIKAMESGASQTGMQYRVKCSTGYTYQEAKKSI